MRLTLRRHQHDRGVRGQRQSSVIGVSAERTWRLRVKVKRSKVFTEGEQLEGQHRPNAELHRLLGETRPRRRLGKIFGIHRLVFPCRLHARALAQLLLDVIEFAWRFRRRRPRLNFVAPGDQRYAGLLHTGHGLECRGGDRPERHFDAGVLLLHAARGVRDFRAERSGSRLIGHSAILPVSVGQRPKMPVGQLPVVSATSGALHSANFAAIPPTRCVVMR